MVVLGLVIGVIIAAIFAAGGCGEHHPSKRNGAVQVSPRPS
jgi:hypothetical protein